MQVRTVIKINEPLLDFAITASKGYSQKLEILTKRKDEPKKHYSNRVVEVLIFEKADEQIAGELDHSYTSIQSNLEIGRSVLIAVRYNSKLIDLIAVTRDDARLTFDILKTIETQHQLNYCDISIDQYFLLSWSLEGQIFVWDLANTQLIQKYQAHSGHTYGVKSAICTPSAE